MSATIDDDLELANEGATSDEWVKDLSESSDNTSIKRGHLEANAQEPCHIRWEGLLGVRNRPDPLLDWDQLYNLKNQSELRRDCRELCSRLNTKIPAHGLESLVTLYCKRRELDYSSGNGWMSIMRVLLSLPFDQNTLYNIFHSITTKYIPRDTSATSKVYDLFRLVVQYHDPQVCSLLDSKKIQPQQYATDWFHSLLSSVLSLDICRQLWDFYFMRGDPFIIFFIALSFLQCVKDQILKLKDKAQIVQLIKESPKNMSEDDISDLFEVCIVTLNCTPDSLRQDFHCMLFGSNLVDDYVDLPLNRLICLPVSAQEIFKKVVDLSLPKVAGQIFNYFVIDARCHDDFMAGNIVGAYNLNSKLIVDEPESFNIAMTSLLEFKANTYPKDHICFVGSGDMDEDAAMIMVISRFLQRNISHLSYVDGGYKAIHAMLKETGNLNKLNSHSEKCLECCNRKEESSGWSIMERMRKSISDKRDAVRSKVQEIVDYSLSATNKPIRHVKSSERNGKRYRNTVFSINDDSDLSNDEELSSNLIASSSNEKLKWADVVKRPDTYKHFEGHEVFQDKSYLKCYILITHTHMYVYHAMSDDEIDSIRLYAHHPLPSILRVTSKRRVPEFLTFKFGHELSGGETRITRVHCFILNKSGDCASAIKQAMHRLGVLSTSTTHEPKSPVSSLPSTLNLSPHS